MQAECTIADTFTVPYFGFVVLRVRSDNPGIWLFHSTWTTTSPPARPHLASSPLRP